MDFKETIKQLTDKVASSKNLLETEEATKMALIVPFIQALGFDVFNPTEVVPEMDCDLIKQKGEKVDYAIKINGEVVILIECKHWKQDLNLHDSQLQKYFVASNARFGILTNGVKYRFFSDLVQQNIMDKNPFLEIDMDNIKDSQIDELRKFHKNNFDVDKVFNSANELKHLNEIKAYLSQEFSTPSEKLVRFVAKQACDTNLKQKEIEPFSAQIKKAVSLYIKDVMSERLNNEPAIKKEDSPDLSSQGFSLVRTIVSEIANADRIGRADFKSYVCVRLDNNSERTICRLYFNSPNKYVAVMDKDRKEVKHKISAANDILSFAEELRETAKRLVSKFPT